VSERASLASDGATAFPNFPACFCTLNAQLLPINSLRTDGHPALQDELTETEKSTNVVFLHTTVDDGRSFSTNPRMDTNIAVAKTESTAARSHREFPERKVTSLHDQSA
jgi:hypothetical protein